jgi:hypothetical protein
LSTTWPLLTTRWYCSPLSPTIRTTAKRTNNFLEFWL